MGAFTGVRGNLKHSTNQAGTLQHTTQPQTTLRQRADTLLSNGKPHPIIANVQLYALISPHKLHPQMLCTRMAQHVGDRLLRSAEENRLLVAG
jgi:hypothetical protein